MSADKLSGLFSPFVGERHADSRCIFNQTFRGEVAAHFANGRALRQKLRNRKRHSSRGISLNLFGILPGQIWATVSSPLPSGLTEHLGQCQRFYLFY